MTKRYILFDLDGTITDSSEGITKSVQHALKKLGIEENDQAMLRRFIGLLLMKALKNFMDLTKKKH
mgnify:CR=1 FL=1